MFTTTDCESQMRIEGELHIPIVKNTFIEVQSPSMGTIRRNSIPADLRLLLPSSEGPLFCEQTYSDASTDIASDALSDSIFDSVSSDKVSVYESSDTSSDSIFDSVSLDKASVDTSSDAFSDSIFDSASLDVASIGRSDSLFDSVSSDQIYEQSSLVVETHRVRSSTRVGCLTSMVKSDKLIRRAAKMLEESGLITEIVFSDHFRSITIRLGDEADLCVDRVLATAQKTFMELTKQSRSIYIMGYSSPNAFIEHTNGFEVTLGAMENATRACWHVFKKGCCRHGTNCSKQHPVYQTIVRVFVEKA